MPVRPREPLRHWRDLNSHALWEEEEILVDIELQNIEASFSKLSENGFTYDLQILEIERQNLASSFTHLDSLISEARSKFLNLT